MMLHRISAPRHMPLLCALLCALMIAAQLALGGGASPANADDAEVTWSVQPSTPTGPDGRTTFDYTAAPGTIISDWVSVTNYSTQTATFRIYGSDAVTDYNTGSFTLIGADQGSTELGAWTSIDATKAVCPNTNDQAEASCAAGLGRDVTLQAGARANLPFTVTVPQDATPGDHAAGIVASFQTTATDSTGSQVNVSQRVGTRIYLRVDGPLNANVGVTGIVSGYDGPWNPFGAGTGHIDFDVTNTGNARLTAAPTVHLTGPFGIDLGTVTLTPVANLLPGGRTHVSATFDAIPPLVLLFADMSVTTSPGDGAVAAGTTPATVTASTVAWAMPWALLGLIVLLVAVVWGTLWWRRRSRRQLADELAEYTQKLRAETLTEAKAETTRTEMETHR